MPGRSPVTARSGPQESRLSALLQDWSAEPLGPEVDASAVCPGCGGPAERTVQDLPAAGLRQTTWRCRADGPRCRPTVKQESIAVAPVGPVIGGWQVRLCVDCGAEYKPAAGNQKRCPECRDKPAAPAPVAGTETPEERRGRLGREAAVRSLAAEPPRTCACGAQFQPTSAIQKRCAECQKAKRPAPSQACYTCGADFVPNRCTQIRCTTCANLKPGARLAIQQRRQSPITPAIPPEITAWPEPAAPVVTPLGPDITADNFATIAAELPAMATCECGAEYQPGSRQKKRCDRCRFPACLSCGKAFNPPNRMVCRCEECRAAGAPLPPVPCYTCGASFAPTRRTQVHCSACVKLKPAARIAVQQRGATAQAAEVEAALAPPVLARTSAPTVRLETCACGAEFQAISRTHKRCRACTHASTVRTCPDCAQEFEPNRGQQRCRPCGKKRQEVQDAARREADKAFWAARRPPVEARRCCCGVEFTPRSAQAVYCPDCSEKAARQKAGTPEHRAERRRRQDEAIARVRAGLPPVDLTPIPPPVQKPEEEPMQTQTPAAPAAVDHPAHYGGDQPYEAIKVIEAWGLGFHLGNAAKYICRAGKKPGADAVVDLRKALWYLEREIARAEGVA